MDISIIWRKKISPKHTWDHIYPSWQQNDLKDGSIFMCLQWLNFVSGFLAVFRLLLWFLQVFLSFGGTMAPNTHIVPYLSFLMTKILGRLIIFYALRMTKSCYLFPDSFCTVIMLSTGISFLWRENCLSKHILGCICSSRQQKLLRDGYFLMFFQLLNLVSWFSAVFGLLL